MATDDHQPPPLSRDDVLRIVDAVRQRAVLVGGQAVAWWAEFYGAQGRLQTVKQATDLYVSRDADFVPGSLWRDDVRALVSDVASQLRGTATYRFAFNSLLVGSITYRDNDGLDRAVEFLRNLHGVEKQESVLDSSRCR